MMLPVILRPCIPMELRDLAVVECVHGAYSNAQSDLNVNA